MTVLSLLTQIERDPYGNCHLVGTCAEIAARESWFWYLLIHHPGALATVVVWLFVVWRLPADCWKFIAEEYRRHANRSSSGRS